MPLYVVSQEEKKRMTSSRQPLGDGANVRNTKEGGRQGRKMNPHPFHVRGDVTGLLHPDLFYTYFY